METSNQKIALKIEKGINLTTDQRRLVPMFVQYCYRALRLQKSYKILLVANREKYNIKTTAVCISNQGKILIFVKGRLLADVFRSVAHEMTHLRQHEHDEHPDSTYLHFSSDLEDGANELAGKLLNAFAEVMGDESIYNEHVQSI